MNQNNHHRKPAPNNLAGGALRTFFNIMAGWQVKDADAITLLGCPRSTFYSWKQAPDKANLSPDTLERMSYIFGIYKDLQILLPKKEAADTWVHRPNSAGVFRGHAPIERMTAGRMADLYVVRQHLDARRGGWA